MSDEEYNGPVIELVISMGYDARSHRVWTKVPPDWDTMSAGDKEIFLQDEAEAFLAEEISADAIVHESVYDAVKTSRDYWGGRFSEDQLEERYH